MAVAAFGTHGATLRLYPSGGGAPRSFFNLSRAYDYPVAWSADSRYLAVELTGTSTRGTSGSGLAVIDTRTLTARVLARGAIEGASFAPSGDRLVYASARAWTVQLKPLRVRRLLVGGKPVQGYAISRDGRSLLLDAGGFEQSPSDGTVEVVGFGGGRPTKLYRGDQPSWDR